MFKDVRKFAGRFPPSAAAIRNLKTTILPRGNPNRGAFDPSEPLVVAGMFRTANGLGQAARLNTEMLKQQGYNPIAVDLSETFKQINGLTETTLEEMPAGSRGTIILHANAPETRAALHALGVRRWQKWRIIGYWAWELSEPPKEWLEIADHLDEIWTPSAFVTEAFRPFVDIPIRTVPLPVRAPVLDVESPANDIESGPLRGLIMADGRSSFHRKNVLAAVRMFRDAFTEQDDTSLTIKFRNSKEFPEFRSELIDLVGGRDSITILDGSVSDMHKWELIASHNVMLSAHRSEGFGLHLAEAMALGKVTMATGWSGNMEFMNEYNSVPLPYRLVPVRDPYGIYSAPKGAVWAAVEEDAGVEALRRLNSDRSSANMIARSAAEDISRRLCGTALLEALAPRTSESNSPG